jgi:hypothetical protein
VISEKLCDGPIKQLEAYPVVPGSLI